MYWYVFCMSWLFFKGVIDINVVTSVHKRVVSLGCLASVLVLLTRYLMCAWRQLTSQCDQNFALKSYV